MQLHESVEQGIRIFHVRGEIDLHYAPVLRSLLGAKAKARCPALILDLREVDFIDSTGLAVLIGYHRDCRKFGGRFCLTGLQGHVRQIFELVHLDTVLPIFRDVCAAVAELRVAGDGDDRATNA